MINRRDLVKLGLVGFVAGLTPAVAYDFYKNNLSKRFLNKEINAILENMVNLETVTKENVGSRNPELELESGLKDEQFKYVKTTGQGIIYGDYILTADHIVSKYVKIIPFPGGAPFMILIDKESEITKTGNYELEEVVKKMEGDLAIFKLPKDYKKPSSKVVLGDSDKLKMLDEIYLIGDPGDLVFTVRKGIMARTGEFGLPVNEFGGSGYLSSFIAAPGDSASPIINDSGEIVGLLTSSYGVYSIFTPINKFKEEIKKYEGGKNK